MSSVGCRQKRVGFSIWQMKAQNVGTLISREGQTARAMAFEAQFAEIEDKSCHLLSCDLLRLGPGCSKGLEFHSPWF